MHKMPRHSGPQLPDPWDQLTLKALAMRGAMTSPARVFMRDCPAREAWNGVEPRTLTFDAFYKAAHFLGAQIRTLGVQPGERVLILLPNTVEAPISILACQLAGAVPAMAAADERAEVLRAAAERCGATMVITTGRVVDLALGEKARQVAAKVMSVRCIAGFGLGLPEGIVSLEGWSEEDIDELPERDRHQSQPGLMTFGREGSSLCAFLRTEGQMVAEALAISSVLRLDGRRGLISLMHPAAAATIAASLLLPLHAGASVRLVGPYDGQTLADVLDADPTAFVFGPDHFMAQLNPDSFGDGRLGNVAGLLALTRIETPDAKILSAGKMDAALLIDFIERGIMTSLKWPRDGKLTLPAIYPHPMESVLPEGTVMLAHEVGANGPNFTGFGAAAIIRREEAGKAA
ncbi:MAG: hypothetical protein CFE31_01190 [Rhizobiales bacterium PAR1]|nr:MAG: hypothetical protein CFE31_01190 [Rhizobiales bacterium PAR1]